MKAQTRRESDTTKRIPKFDLENFPGLEPELCKNQVTKQTGKLLCFWSDVEAVIVFELFGEKFKAIFNKDVLYINDAPCKTSLFACVTVGALLSFNAVRLEGCHASGAEFRAAKVWNDTKGGDMLTNAPMPLGYNLIVKMASSTTTTRTVCNFSGLLERFVSESEGVMWCSVFGGCEALFSRNVFYVDKVLCDNVPLSTHLKLKELLYFNATELPQPHVSGARFIATLVWKGKKPSKHNLSNLPTEAAENEATVYKKEIGYVSTILNANEIIITGNFNNRETKVLCDKNDLYVQGEHCHPSVDISSFIKLGAHLFFDCVGIKKPHHSGAEFQCQVAWIGKKPETVVDPGEEMQERNKDTKPNFMFEHITYKGENIIPGKIYDGVVVKLLRPFSFVISVECKNETEHVFAMNHSFSLEVLGKQLPPDSCVKDFVAVGDHVEAILQRSYNEAKRGRTYKWYTSYVWKVPAKETVNAKHPKDNKNEKHHMVSRMETMIGEVLSVLDGSGTMRDASENEIEFCKAKAELFGISLSKFDLPRVLHKGQKISFIKKLSSGNAAGGDGKKNEIICFGEDPCDPITQSAKIYKYCEDNNINDEVVHKLIEQLGSQLEHPEKDLPSEKKVVPGKVEQENEGVTMKSRDSSHEENSGNTDYGGEVYISDDETQDSLEQDLGTGCRSRNSSIGEIEKENMEGTLASSGDDVAEPKEAVGTSAEGVLDDMLKLGESQALAVNACKSGTVPDVIAHTSHSQKFHSDVNTDETNMNKDQNGILPDHESTMQKYLMDKSEDCLPLNGDVQLRESEENLVEPKDICENEAVNNQKYLMDESEDCLPLNGDVQLRESENLVEPKDICENEAENNDDTSGTDKCTDKESIQAAQDLDVPVIEVSSERSQQLNSASPDSSSSEAKTAVGEQDGLTLWPGSACDREPCEETGSDAEDVNDNLICKPSSVSCLNAAFEHILESTLVDVLNTYGNESASTCLSSTVMLLVGEEVKKMVLASDLLESAFKSAISSVTGEELLSDTVEAGVKVMASSWVAKILENMEDVCADVDKKEVGTMTDHCEDAAPEDTLLKTPIGVCDIVNCSQLQTNVSRGVDTADGLVSAEQCIKIDHVIVEGQRRTEAMQFVNVGTQTVSSGEVIYLTLFHGI